MPFAVSQQREDLLRGVIISTDLRLYTGSHEERSVYFGFYLHRILTKKKNRRFSSDLKVSLPYLFFHTHLILNFWYFRLNEKQLYGTVSFMGQYYKTVLHLSRLELTSIVAACTMLHFEFVGKSLLITRQYFGSA